MCRILFHQKSKSEKYKYAEFHFIKKVKVQFHNSILFRRGHGVEHQWCSTSPVRKLINALNYLKK